LHIRSAIVFVVIIINNFKVSFRLQLRDTGRLWFRSKASVWMEDWKVGDKTDVDTETALQSEF